MLTTTALLVVCGLSAGNVAAQLVTNPTGDPVGGGEGYSSILSPADATQVVSTRDELVQALNAAASGAVIYVQDDSEIDLTGLWALPVKPGVVLASGRGRDGSLGALLFTSTEAKEVLLQVEGPGVRITGLRIKGPSTRIDNPHDCGGYDARGISAGMPEGNPVSELDLEVDNCELWAWPYAGVALTNVTGPRVHHNHIHHNRRRETKPGCCRGYGLGYGVVTNRGDVEIDANLFNHNRHDIASTGRPGSSYAARYNVSVEGLIGHAFDMHGGPDRPGRPEFADDPLQAGDTMLIEQNVFYDRVHEHVVIRGRPKGRALIKDNRFRLGSGKAAGNSVRQKHVTPWQNIEFEDNAYNIERLRGWFISYGAHSYWKLRAISDFDPKKLFIVDVDNDGADDIVRVRGGVSLYVSRSGMYPWELLYSSSEPLRSSELAFGDFDGDGATDAFRTDGERWYVALGIGGPWVEWNTSSIRASSLRFGRFDEDDRTDVFRANGTNWFVSKGGSESWVEWNASSLRVESLAFGDFDGDGRTDVFRANGEEWFLSKGASESWESWQKSTKKLDALGFCNFDGDETTDVFHMCDGTWMVSWGGTSRWKALGASSYKASTLAFGDFNGDGRCDVMTRRDGK